MIFIWLVSNEELALANDEYETLPSNAPESKKKWHKLVQVSDDWYPNVNDEYASISWLPKWNAIIISGDDDFAMKKENSTEKEFEKLCKLILNQKYLKSIGFIQD